MNQSDRCNYIDLLRIASITAVVVLHASVNIAGNFGLTKSLWWQGHIWDSVTRWCVPILFMISGAVQLKPIDQPWKYLRKRAGRILIPYLFWCVVYIIFMYRDQLSNLLNLAPEILLRVLNVNLQYHLWFIPVILGLYIITPILSPLVANANKKIIEYFLLLWVFVKIVMFIFPINMFGEIEMMKYLGFYILGFYLHNYELKYKPLWYLLAVLSTLLTIVGTYIFSTRINQFDHRFYDYLSPNVILISIGVFVLFKNINWGTIPLPLKIYCEISYGIYLLHILILDVLQYNILLDINQRNILGIELPPILGIPVLALSIIIICFVIIASLNKLPVVKRIVS